MYPALTLGPFTLPSYDVAMLAAMLLGTWLGTRQARHVGVDPMIAWQILPWAAVGGIVGAKAYAALSHLDEVVRHPAALANVGLVWYGGAIVGTAAAAWRFRRAGLPLHLLFDYGAAPMAFGHAVGRVGCFLVGDDYGLPTNLPWAVSFPHGAPPSTAGNLRAVGAHVPPAIPDSQVLAVHPTQLYEVAALVLIGSYLWRASRAPHRPWTVFARYALLYGAWRFLVEFIRAKEDRFSFGLTTAQLVSVGVVALGAALLWHARTANEPAHAARA